MKYNIYYVFSICIYHDFVFTLLIDELSGLLIVFSVEEIDFDFAGHKVFPRTLHDIIGLGLPVTRHTIVLFLSPTCVD